MERSVANYRETPARCPACRVMMEPRQLYEATVDICSDCQGVWVDWFDGELERVVDEVGPPRQKPVFDSSSLDRNCPRCQDKLGAEERGEGGTVFRCGECGGAFVPRVSFEPLLARLHAEPIITADALRWLPARLAAILERLLSGKE